jgi:Icc-related predicted phosphoesterase
MKILLITDTHGHIDNIVAKSLLTEADICLHTGDFGFYNFDSIKALNQKELHLQIKHSSLDEKENLLTASAKTKENVIRENKLLGNFEEYLNCNQLLGFPTYAICGNHDDANVVYKLKNNPIPYLHIVDENKVYNFGNTSILGVSGNCLINNTFTLQKSNSKVLEELKMQGCQCRPTSTLFNYIKLVQMSKSIPKNNKLILMFHPSPIEETFLELVSWQCNATLTLSGHMGLKDGRRAFTTNKDLPRLVAFYKKLLAQYPQYKKELEIFNPIAKDLTIEHVNLPDSKDGYGLLEIIDDNYVVTIYGASYHSKLLDTLGEDLYQEIILSKEEKGKEYSLLLGQAKKIINKEITNEEKIAAILLQLFDYCNIPSGEKAFIDCLKVVKLSNPNFEKEYLNSI